MRAKGAIWSGDGSTISYVSAGFFALRGKMPHTRPGFSTSVSSMPGDEASLSVPSHATVRGLPLASRPASRSRGAFAALVPFA